MNEKCLFLSSKSTTPGVRNILYSEISNYGLDVFDFENNQKIDYGSDELVDTLNSTSIVIADVSDDTNDFIIGQVFILKKPILFISNSKNNLNIKYSKFLILIYNEQETVGQLKNNFSRILSITLSNISKQHIMKPIEQLPKKQIFISYCHNDIEYLERLLVHLKPIERNGKIDIWVDTRIKSGDKWKKYINDALSIAGVGILLISADFMASDFIIDNELPPLLLNAQKAGTRIIPIIVKPCRFLREKSLNEFQAINDPKSPLNSLTEDERENIYDSIAQRIEELLQ